jgi:hypothetical protein
VRLLVSSEDETGRVCAELQLGERFKFFPSNAALADWRAQSQVEIVFDN